MEDGWIEEILNAELESVPIHFHLGEIDAREEWVDEENYVPIFVHTKSYTQFSELDYLFMYGRRGIGKTSIIRMLEYDILNNNSKHFSFCSLVDADDAFTTLSSQLRGSPLINYPLRDLTILLKEKWKWVIEVAAMRSLVKQQDKVNGRFTSQITIINNYLENNGFLSNNEFEISKNKRLLLKIASVFSEELGKVDNETTKISSALFEIGKKIITPDFNDSRSALYTILKEMNSRCLVVADSIDAFPFEDVVYQGLFAGLIEACLDLSITSKKYGVFCKAAFPAEMETHLTPLNKGKVAAHRFFIRWNYADLVIMTAKRFKRMLYGEGEIDDPTEYEYLDDKNKALKYMYSIIPDRIESISGVMFDTMAYIIRHTQKKPRQLIQMLNTIISIAEYLNEKDAISDVVIREGIHIALNDLIAGTLNIYDQIYHRVPDLIRNALTNQKNHMTMSGLDVAIKGVKDLRKQLRILTNQLKTIMFAVGCIGKRLNIHELNNSDAVWVSQFEYQIKNRISFNLETYT